MRVFCSFNEEYIVGFVTEILMKAGISKLETRDIPVFDDLIKESERNTPDGFIVILNNSLVQMNNKVTTLVHLPDIKLEETLNDLKKRFNKPVICLTGHDEIKCRIICENVSIDFFSHLAQVDWNQVKHVLLNNTGSLEEVEPGIDADY